MGDDEITNLQKGISWFKTAASKLNQILEQQKYELQGGKFRQGAQYKDVKYMESHLKECKKQNKMIKLGIEKRQK